VAKSGSATPSFCSDRRRCPPGLERDPLVRHLSKQRHFLFSPPWMLYEPVDDIQSGSLPSHSRALTVDFLALHVVRLFVQLRHLTPGPGPDLEKMVRDIKLSAFGFDRPNRPPNLAGNFSVRKTTQPLDFLLCPIARAGKSVRYSALLSLQHHGLDGPPCLCGDFRVRLPSQ